MEVLVVAGTAVGCRHIGQLLGPVGIKDLPALAVILQLNLIFQLLVGRGMFLFPMRYPSYPAAWYRQVRLPLPDTVLLTLRDDPRPEISTLRRVFTEFYGERIKALLP